MANLRIQGIPTRYLPLIVFTDCTSGFIEWAIKWRTKGNYNHVQWMHKKAMFASQGNTYSEVPYTRYAKPGGRLKFVEVVFENREQKKFILDSIAKKLKMPWYKRMYDWIGIFGQAVGMKWINTPGLEYCSEDVPDHLKKLANSNVKISDELRAVLLGIPDHCSPHDFNEYQKQNRDYFRVYGRWDSDAEN